MPTSDDWMRSELWSCNKGYVQFMGEGYWACIIAEVDGEDRYRLKPIVNKQRDKVVFYTYTDAMLAVEALYEREKKKRHEAKQGAVERIDRAV